MDTEYREDKQMKVMVVGAPPSMNSALCKQLQKKKKERRLVDSLRAE